MLASISSYLQDSGISTTIYEGNMPDSPDTCIALFEYAGSPPDLHWNGEYPGLQVRSRAKAYATAKSNITEAIQKLHGVHEVTMSGTRYLLIKARGSPEIFQRDESNRVELFVNFEIIKEV